MKDWPADRRAHREVTLPKGPKRLADADADLTDQKVNEDGREVERCQL